jgi:hypothetical protein
MNIVELLALRGLNTKAKIKLVRHQDKRYDVWELYRTRYLDTYQSYQSKPVFAECEYIVVFIGLDSSRARFVGIYRVNGSKPAIEIPLPSDHLYPDMARDTDIFYYLEPMAGFEDLKDRVVIDWGKSALAWHQWLSEKEVIEILPKGYVTEFPGYLDFIITFDELVSIIENPEANREWHRMLKAVAGVYLITDTKTGKQYVGSAYGENGILGRWTEYAKNPHGENGQLKALLLVDYGYAKNFQYTILRTLPKTLTKNEVIAYEGLYKKKLGSRAFGLNSN